jgi:hypothetical protein
MIRYPIESEAAWVMNVRMLFFISEHHVDKFIYEAKALDVDFQVRRGSYAACEKDNAKSGFAM